MRHGFALIEVAIALILLAIFATLVVVVVRGAGTVALRSSSALLADRAVLSLQVFLREELRAALSSDVTSFSPARIGISRSIGEAFTCADTGGVVLIADTAWSGTRTPQAGRDQVLLLVDPPGSVWQRLSIDSVSTDRCPLDNAPAIWLQVALHAGRAAVARVMEPVEVSAYRSGTADWFGLTPANRSAPVQPFAGPLVPSGSRFTWYADHLEVVIAPTARSVATVQLPLGAP